MATIFRNGNVIVGTGEIVAKGTVAVDGNAITYVGPNKRFKISKRDTFFDISGKTILPGLIDGRS